jgi:hypothetical protein
MAALVPGMTIVQAFSHIDWQYLTPKATTEPGIYAADDPAADKMVEELIADMGYVPYRIGTLAESAVLDFDGALSHFSTPGHVRTALADARSTPDEDTSIQPLQATRSSATKTGSARLQPAPAEGFLLSSG